MEGLRFINEIPERITRDEFKILRDEPVYEVMKMYASKSDMQEIDGWARSFYTLEGHLESIMQYQKPLLPEPTDKFWNTAKSDVLNEMRSSIPPVSTLKFETQLDDVRYESSSAAGYGYQGKKGENENLKRAKRIANALVRTYAEQRQAIGIEQARINLAEDSTPDIAFTRTQLAKLPSIKVRNVYGEAFHYILIEGLSAYPILNVLKSLDTFYLTGKDPKDYVPKYLVEQDDSTGWFIVMDWKSFDATVQLWEIDHAFNCIEAILTFPSELSQLAFEVSRECFKVRKLAAPDGKLWMRTGGIPSGSYYTNIVGSIINYTRIKYLCSRINYTIKSCKVQGDDSVTKIREEQRPDILAMADIAQPLGWILSGDKCTVTKRSDQVTFLGRTHLQLFNIRERLKVLRLMCFPEYEVDDPKISSARVRMIAQDAGGRDPLYNKILQAMINLYGIADHVPPRYVTYTDTSDFIDVIM